MTNPEELSPLPQQEFIDVVQAAAYLGRGDVLLFPSGSEVALYHTETVDDSTNQFVFATTYPDISGMTTQAAQEINGPADISSIPTPEDAQQLLDNLFAAAAEQNRFMGIMNAPDIGGQSSYYILFTEADSTIADKQIITRNPDGSLPIVAGFDAGSHSVYQALTLAHSTLVSN